MRTGTRVNRWRSYMMLCFVLVLALCAGHTALSQTPTPTPTATPTPTPTATPTPTPSPTPLAFTKLRFDGDGQSDLTVVEVQNDSSENTYVYHSVLSGGGTQNPEFGRSQDGDLVAPGDYDGDGTTNHGYIEISNGELIWNVQSFAGGSDVSSNFGSRGDIAISGCDFDGNGQSDLAYISGDTFAARNITDTNITTFSIGRRRGNRDYSCADVNGDGHEELLALDRIVLRKRSRRRRALRAFHVRAWDSSGQELISSSADFRNTDRRNKKLLVSGDVNSDGTEDYGYVKKSGSSASMVMNVAGTTQSFTIQLPKFGSKEFTPVTVLSSGGDLVDAVVYRLKSGNQFFTYNFTDQSESAIDLSSLSVTASEVTLLRSVNVHRTGGGGGGNSGGGGGGSGNLSSVCPSIVSPGGGILWKPASDVSDSRGGKPVILFTGSKKPGRSTLAVYASNGTQIGSTGFKASSIPGINDGAEHYFSGCCGGSGSSAGGFASAARSAAGSQEIYVKARGNSCVRISSPTSRAGNI